jgi:hypothetical protein
MNKVHRKNDYQQHEKNMNKSWTRYIDKKYATKTNISSMRKIWDEIFS